MRITSRMVISCLFSSWFFVSFYACTFCIWYFLCNIFQNRDVVGNTCDTWGLARNRVCTPQFSIKNILLRTQIAKASMHQKWRSKNEDSIRKCEMNITVSFSWYNWISEFVWRIFHWDIFLNPDISETIMQIFWSCMFMWVRIANDLTKWSSTSIKHIQPYFEVRNPPLASINEIKREACKI